MSDRTTKALKAQVNFAPGLSVDGYQLPDGSFYLSITSASQVIGFNRNWLSRNIEYRW